MLTQWCAGLDKEVYLWRTSALRRLQDDLLFYVVVSRLARDREVCARKKDQAIVTRSSAAKIGFAGLRRGHVHVAEPARTRR